MQGSINIISSLQATKAEFFTRFKTLVQLFDLHDIRFSKKRP